MCLKDVEIGLCVCVCVAIYHQENAEKIKVFKVLPYLVSNVVEVGTQKDIHAHTYLSLPFVLLLL